VTCSLHAGPIEHTLHVGRDVNASRLDWSQDKQFGLSLGVDAERFGSVLGQNFGLDCDPGLENLGLKT